jgi:hypothetical protein
MEDRSRNMHLTRRTFVPYTPALHVPPSDHHRHDMQTFALTAALLLLAMPASGFKLRVYRDRNCETLIAESPLPLGSGELIAYTPTPGTMSAQVSLEPSDQTNVE